MNKIQLAFLEWQKTFPGTKLGPPTHYCESFPKLVGKIFRIPLNWDGDCPCQNGSANHVRISSNNKIVPTADKLVCKRERAWRKYTQLRDYGEYLQ